MNENTVKENNPAEIIEPTYSFKDLTKEEQAVLTTFAMLAKKFIEADIENGEGYSRIQHAHMLLSFLLSGLDFIEDTLCQDSHVSQDSRRATYALNRDITHVLQSSSEDCGFFECDSENGPTNDLAQAYKFVKAIIEKEESKKPAYLQQLSQEEILNEKLNSFSGDYKDLTGEEQQLIMTFYTETLWILDNPSQDTQDIYPGMVVDYLFDRAGNIFNSDHTSAGFKEVFGKLESVITHEVTSDKTLSMISDYFREIIEKS